MRYSRAKARLQLELDLIAEAEQLQAAKEAYAANPCEETRAARRAAMQFHAETRTWLRALYWIAKHQRRVDELAARGATEAELAPYKQKVAGLQRDHGELIAAMEELGTGAPTSDPGELPPGSADVMPAAVRGRARAGNGGV